MDMQEHGNVHLASNTDDFDKGATTQLLHLTTSFSISTRKIRLPIWFEAPSLSPDHVRIMIYISDTLCP